VLSGVLIYAASKIYGRKVDYLEQEIIGIAKNFESLDTSNEKHPEKEIKKTRTKKFVIKDGVNLEKVSFEECPITILTKVEINKTLEMPRKINRLEKMKEFFTKNRSKTGKLVVPKKLSFMSDLVVSNFGSTQIYDYDDNKDVVGSRRDFTSFSFYINAFTGELQSEISLMNCQESEFHMENRENILIPSRSVSPDGRGSSPVDWTRPDTPVDLHLPEVMDTTEIPEVMDTSDPVKDSLHNTSINIDEGIEMDEADKASMLLPITPPPISLPSFFPPANESFEIETVVEPVKAIEEPQKLEKVAEPQMKNVFMVPLKKLKHRCLFDLPNEEYGELKRLKREQSKSGVADSMRQTRIFNPFEIMRLANITCDPDEPPFMGFTKAQQKEPMTYIDYQPKVSRDRSRSPIDALRKYSNDSGLAEADCPNEVSTEDIDLTVDRTETEVNSSGDQTSLELSSAKDSSIDQSDSTINASQDTEKSPNISLDEAETSAIDDSGNVNNSGADSCYQSLASGESSKAELSSFFKDIESRNATINESRESEEDDDFNESEERVMQMQQSAINVSCRMLIKSLNVSLTIWFVCFRSRSGRNT
jgi:hypothetical protein